MITFEKIDALKVIYQNAYESFYLQILEHSYNEDYQKAIYKTDYVTPFKDEFHNVLSNSKIKRLKKYIDKVYYEDIVMLYIKFSNLRKDYIKKSNLSFGQLANAEDNDLFNRIDGHGYGLGDLARMIYSEAKREGFNLKDYQQITLTDYNIRGQYMPLFPKPEPQREVATIEDKQAAQQEPKQVIKTKVPDNNYSQRQIAIAYFVMQTPITKDNAEGILKKHSQTKSVPKLLQKRITKASEITNLSENKTTDTKHKQDLTAAKRLISGIKNKKAITDITSFISTFETNYTAKHN